MLEPVVMIMWGIDGDHEVLMMTGVVRFKIIVGTVAMMVTIMIMTARDVDVAASPTTMNQMRTIMRLKLMMMNASRAIALMAMFIVMEVEEGGEGDGNEARR